MQRRGWLGFLLNLVLPPSGYVYVGRLDFAVTLAVLPVALGLLVFTWSVLEPPGVYRWLSQTSWAFWAAAYLLNSIVAAHAAWLCGKASRPALPLWALWVLAVVLWGLPLALGASWQAVGPITTYTAASSSMEPTLRAGDIIAVRGRRWGCAAAGVQPGDVVVYRRQAGPPSISRIVASPGSTVAMKGGRLLIDGRPVDVRSLGKIAAEGSVLASEATVLLETLPNGTQFKTLDFGPGGVSDEVRPTPVPKGKYYLISDSRDNALDSRVNGPVDRTDICGTVVKILRSENIALIGSKP